ncbi:MAG: hypothetical protein KOO62_13455 [candidate division Zixibacteria bacterium]|nr:hypothetical protein [candidate division Zixibacteria bacterium]
MRNLKIGFEKGMRSWRMYHSARGGYAFADWQTILLVAVWNPPGYRTKTIDINLGYVIMVIIKP